MCSLGLVLSEDTASLHAAGITPLGDCFRLRRAVMQLAVQLLSMCEEQHQAMLQ
jgi:hypothetical protein